jgi:hypothetical protein
VAAEVLSCERGAAAVELLGGRAGEEAGKESFLDVVGGRTAHDGGVDEARGEPEYGAEDGDEAAHAHEEREHAACVGQRAVEVERGDGGAFG